MTDNTELKRLAEAATSGPWSMCGEADGSQGFEIIQDIWNEHGTHTGKDVVVYEWSDEGDPLGVINRQDAEFIAAANPAAVLALIAENERLRKERDARHPFKPFHEPSIGFTGCVICGVYTDHGGLPCPKTRATADAVVGQEMIWCACGDGYPVNSHGAGFMDANNGVCANCDSANQGAEPDLDAPNSLAVLRKALSDLLALYDEDEGCRNLPQYIAGRAAMGKGGQS